MSVPLSFAESLPRSLPQSLPWLGALPESRELHLAEMETPEPLRYRVLPEVEVAPSLLELRLAALVADRAQERERDGLVEFDVEGLVSTLEGVLADLRQIAQVSVHVRDLETQHVLFDSEGDIPLIPASNQKILTTSAALDLLGPEYTFRTVVSYAPSQLCLRGEGDPVLHADDLSELAHQVVSTIDLGTVTALVIDDGAFSSTVFGPGYSSDGDGVAYEAPSGALSVDFNSVEVVIWPGRRGARPHVRMVPESTQIELVNAARTGRRTGLHVRSRAEGGATIVEVSGGIAVGARPWSTRRRTGDPGLFTGGVFAQLLAQRSASEPLPVTRGRCPDGDEGWEPVAEHESPALVEVLDRGMAYSNNFISEQVLRTMAWQMTGGPGDWDVGRDILHDYWSSVLARSYDVVIENGSGLGHGGRLTTQGLVDLISMAHRHAASGHAGSGRGLLDTLPVAGDPGTLRSRLRRSGHRVRAKTGTLAGVSALTGVITREDGTPQLAFSMLTNVQVPGTLYAEGRRRIEDRVVMALLAALDDHESRRTASSPGGIG